MAQSFEYYMFSPHPKAKLYKRFTGDVPIELKDNEIITVQDNRYVYAGKLLWVEETDKDTSDEQPIDGLLVNNSYMTIKTNTLKEIKNGDIIELPPGMFGGMWIVTEGIQVGHVYTPKPVQTYQYIPLSSM